MLLPNEKFLINVSFHNGCNQLVLVVDQLRLFNSSVYQFREFLFCILKFPGHSFVSEIALL